jgi:ribosomal protein S18 acetylase RimI-like enzyme
LAGTFATTDSDRAVEVTRTYLELSAPLSPGPAISTVEPVRLEHAADCPASFFRYLYAEVGRRYHWVDRLPWTDTEIKNHLSRKAISIWVMYLSGSPAGYFELERHADGSAEIAYFGLMDYCLGRGLGKYLLTQAIEKGWAANPTRVWLHTCSLDDPAALPNYLKRGFRPYKQETYQTMLSAEEIRWLERRVQEAALASRCE